MVSIISGSGFVIVQICFVLGGPKLHRGMVLLLWHLFLLFVVCFL